MAKAIVLTPKEALVQWAKRNAINPVKLAEKVGYSYMHCWSLLRGDTAITAETLGRLVLAFGTESVAEIAKAMVVNCQDPQDAAPQTSALSTTAQNGKKKGTGPLGKR